MPKVLTVYDLIILQQYFANKKKPTAHDKELAKKIDSHLVMMADGLVQVTCSQVPV